MPIEPEVFYFGFWMSRITPQLVASRLNPDSPLPGRAVSCVLCPRRPGA